MTGLLRAAVLALVVLVTACGDDAVSDGDAVATTTAENSTTSAAELTTTSTTEASTTSTSTTTSAAPPTIDPVVLSADGLGVVEFGDDAETALAVLIEVLGQPDHDTGWTDPSEPETPLWPGCPGLNGRIVGWDEPGIFAVFNDWDQASVDPRATVEAPYLAGAGLSLDSTLTTPDGARSGDTVAHLQAIYGDRFSVVSSRDGPVPQVFAIDGTTINGPLDRTGGLRGSIYSDPTTEEPVAVAFTAGLSCNSP